mmetsp:Transcript_63791/g.75490  ORF Transcript_63791/g.75490 Transcript_63791/m.75490 type:complete len:157 (-) Transcript_63791:193-663(-)|eukprot:CAMPEP_0172497900 /NCGR_PEP_ID=MMETSP1066-20121228/106753_1 /TAXON_ID=671091 /ORGANISM="Coscinodiscus wailesii, Strain CCMP2513" /LENGTH=156 /DNA_ID=CAMNT_0013270925 /DNA_START=104 /DNA_END=574 /DNA_ORIENTATION=-
MARSRRGGGGGMFSRSKPAPARRPASTSSRAPAPTPAPAPPAPMQQAPSGGGMLSGIGSTIAQGMAFGTGSAIAHRAVGAVAGSMSGGGDAPAQQHDQQIAAPQQDMMPNANAGACAQDKTMFYECLQQNKGDQQSCAFLYDMLKECQRNETQMYN